MTTAVETGRPGPGELLPALDLFYRHLGPLERGEAVAEMLDAVASGGLGPDNFVVARRGRSLIGAAVWWHSPASVGQLLPPQSLPGADREAVLDALVAAALAHLRGAGVKLIQSLLRREESDRDPALLRHGFRPAGSLLLLRHDLRGELAEPDGRTDFSPYAGADRGEFEATLLSSYEGSLDFPELNGVRPVAEVLAGHRGHSALDPPAWFLARRGGRPAGVLVLTQPDPAEWELSYLGVVPAARGQGVGRDLVRQALRRAAQAGAARLTVAVDTRNLPAWYLYARTGFLPFAEHAVYLLLPSGPG